MIDIQLLRDEPELVARKSKEKNVDVDVQKVLEFDERRRAVLQQVEALRQKRNEISEQMKSATTGGGKPDDSLIAQGKQIKDELQSREDELRTAEESFNAEFSKIPNPHFDDVPVGVEGEGETVETFGDCETTGAVDHLDFASQRDWVDFERGAKVAGSKFYFLKGDLALLENALTQFALEVMQKHDFTYMTVPHLVNSSVAEATGFAPRSDEQSDEYYIDGEDLSLIATSEMSLTGYHADEIIDEAQLPLTYSGYSACYRKEAGTYGKHTRGLFRVHQFNKVEMYIFCVPELSRDMHEKLLAIEQEIWQAIGIPYRVVNIPSGDLGAPAAKKYDIEYWSKVDGDFRELTSTSNCTDFQSRNANIRVRRGDGTVEYLHTLNGTAIAHARSLVAILEHYQTVEGKLRVPDVLQKYMGGKKEL